MKHYLFALVLLCASVCFAQGGSVVTGTPVVSNPLGQPIGGATVAICTTDPGSPTVGGCPGHLATLYTDITLGTACSGTSKPLSNPGGAGSGCSNPGTNDGSGNVIAFGVSGQYWCEYYGTALRGVKVIPCIFPTTASGGSFTFVNVTATGTITGKVIGNERYADKFANIQAAITDAGATGSVVIPANYGGVDTFTNPNNILITDKRSGVKFFKAGDITNPTSLTGWGDSITYGTGASTCTGGTLDTCYFSLIGYNKAFSLTDDGVSGSGIADAGEADAIFASTFTATANATLLTGVNDMRNINTNAAQEVVYRNALLAVVQYLATPTTNLIKGQSGSANLTYTGSWSNTSVYGGTLGKQTVTQNDQVQIANLYGTTVYVVTLAQVANTATVNVAIDGVDHGTYALVSTLTTLQGRTYQPFLLRFANLREGAHTVVFKKADAGASPAYFLWAAANGGLYNNTGPFVWLGNCIRFTAAGYIASGGSDNAVRDFNELIRGVAMDLSTDGLQVNLVDVAGGYDTATMSSGDGVHPNDTGHAYIASAFEKEMNGLLSLRDRNTGKSGGLGGVFERFLGAVYLRLPDAANSYNFQDNTATFTPLAAKSYLNGSASNAGLLFSGNDTYVRSGAALASTHIQDGAATETFTFAATGTTNFNNSTIQTANGALWTQGQTSELITLSTSGTTTDSVGNLLPANSIIEAVVARVTTTITTATDWKLGDSTISGRFSGVNAVMTVGSTQVGTVQADQTGTSGPRQVSAAKLRITTTGTPGAGVIRVTVFYRSFTPPTS